MKITSVETFLVPPRWLFCKISTDEGIVGWGEPVVEGRAETVRAAVHELEDLLVGSDPMRIEDHWQVLSKSTFYRGGPVLSSAVAGIDQALWDIAGKALDVPVHTLLGGHVRDRVRMYAWVGGDDPSGIDEAVAAQVEAGLTAVKMNAVGPLGPIATAADVAGALERARTARERLGSDRDVALDFHGRVSPANAPRLLRALEEVAPLFVEEPVLPEHRMHLARLSAGTTVPLATGERLFSRGDFLPALQAGIAVVQPDPSHAGGISELRRIAALAETFGASFAPHCPLGPVSLAAALQVDFATPNFLIQEQSMGLHYNRPGAELTDYLVDTAPLRIVDGYVERPVGPGLGIQIDEDAVRRAAEIGHRWRGPVWRHPDGGFAEW